MDSITPQEPPKVFISYSWSNDSHVRWVMRFVTRLRESGVDVILDRTHCKHGDDLIAFMEKMVTDKKIQRVLIICDSVYAEKADGREGGVGKEAQIITPDLYGKTEQDKFLPLYTERTEEGEFAAPTFLKSRFGFNFADEAVFEEEFKKLILQIFDKPLYELPPLGTPPAYIYATNRFTHQTSSAFEDFRAMISPLQKTPQFASRNYLNSLIDVYRVFPISEEQELPLLDRLMEAIEATKSYRDEFVQFVMSWIFLEDITIFVREVHRFFEHCAPLVYHSRTEHLMFFAREVFLYFVSILIREDRTEDLNWFFSESYVFEQHSRPISEGFWIFENHLPLLHEKTNKRLHESGRNGRVSVVADVIKDRIREDLVSISDLLQAEFVLAVRSALHSGRGRYWFPRFLTCGGDERLYHPFPVFARAIEKRYIPDLLNIVGFDDMDRFRDALDKTFESGVFNALQMREWWDCDYSRMMAYQYLFPDQASGAQ